jgi:hypothetical protein
MSWWARFQRWRKRFKEVIILQGEPYLIRYRIWSTKRCGIYLHKILRTDTDRNLHDHPFDFTSIILWGGYWEHGRQAVDHWREHLPPHGLVEQTFEPVRRWYGIGSIIRHWACDLHRVELDRPAWTLFIRGPRVREWGFLTEDGWVPWDKYENLGEYASQGASSASANPPISEGQAPSA